MALRKVKKRRVYAKTRPSRETTARRGVLVLLAVLTCLAVLFGVSKAVLYVGSLFFSRNPHFEIKHIVMRSDGRLSPSQLQGTAGIEPGMNLFSIDFDELRERLEARPLVESVRIKRRLPDTIFVDVTERVAVAQVNWKWRAVPFLIDRHGVVIPPTRSGRSLPLIEGIKFDKLQPGETIEAAGVGFVLELLSTCDEILAEYDKRLAKYNPNTSEYRTLLAERRFFANLLQFERFDLRNSDYIVATLAQGTHVQFPLHSAKSKLITLAVVLQKDREMGRPTPKTADLTPDGRNVPVTY